MELQVVVNYMIGMLTASRFSARRVHSLSRQVVFPAQHVRMGAGTHGGHKKGSNLWKLELCTVLSTQCGYKELNSGPL